MTLPDPTRSVVANKLRQLGFDLPSPPEPKGHYAGARLVGHEIRVSGHTDRGRGGLTPQVPLLETREGISAARAAAEHAAVNLLASAAAVCDLDELTGVIVLRGYVVAESAFTAHPTVVDAASHLLGQVLGGPPHARVAIGVSSLPGGAIVELEAVLERRDGDSASPTDGGHP